MKQTKVTLGAPERHAPTSGYVRQEGEGIAEKLSNPLAYVHDARAGLGGGTEYPPAGHARAAAAAGGGADAHTYACEEAAEFTLASWRKLSQADRRHVLALMSLELQQASGRGDGKVELWSEAVHEALVAALGPSDGAAHGPQVVRRVVGAPGPWGPVAEFLTSSGLEGRLDRNGLYSAMRLLARLLVQRCRQVADRADIPLTPKLVAQNAQHIAGIVDGSFPGYAAAGLLHFIVRQQGAAA